MKKRIAFVVGMLTVLSTGTAFAEKQATPSAALRQDAKDLRVATTSAIRQEIKDARTDAMLARSEFLKKLALIKDIKKKEIVTRFDTRITELNTLRTSIMFRELGVIEDVLNRLEIRTLNAEASGKNVAVVKTAIATARTAIATAKNKVMAQSTKVYTVTITTEDKLGAAVSTVRLQLTADLQLSHQSVISARKSVVAVLQALAKNIGEKLTTTSAATPSATPVAE